MIRRSCDFVFVLFVISLLFINQRLGEAPGLRDGSCLLSADYLLLPYPVSVMPDYSPLFYQSVGILGTASLCKIRKSAELLEEMLHRHQGSNKVDVAKLHSLRRRIPPAPFHHHDQTDSSTLPPKDCEVLFPNFAGRGFALN